MRQWIQSHDRASCQSVITVSPSSSQVLPFQGKAPDTGAHPRLFLLGLNSCDHQGPTSARPESFMKPLLSPLPQLSLFLSPLTRHGLLFPHWAPSFCSWPVPLSPLIPPLHCHHSDLSHPDCYCLCLKRYCLRRARVHCSCVARRMGPSWHSMYISAPTNGCLPLQTPVLTLQFFLSTGYSWLISWGSVQVSLWLPGSSGGAEKPSSFPSPDHITAFITFYQMDFYMYLNPWPSISSNSTRTMSEYFCGILRFIQALEHSGWSRNWPERSCYMICRLYKWSM